MKKPNSHFVFVVDSHSDHSMNTGLEALGLRFDNGYHVTGAGGADIIMMKISGRYRFVDCEHLLVFMSSFHGEVEPAVELAKKIKEANPKARIIFRSDTERSSDPVFEKCMRKGRDAFFEIVKGFLPK